MVNKKNLFDEMMKSQFEVDETGLHQIAVKRNLWQIFFEAIKIYPKFLKLKNMIEKSDGAKNDVEQLIAREALEKYLLSKRFDEQMRRDALEKKKKKVRIDTNEDNLTIEKKEEVTDEVKNEVEDLMKDHEKFANI
jgi:hypothetical protein